MKFCISLGIFDLKYFLYFILYSILEIIIILFIYDDDNNIKDKHPFLNSLFLFVGYLLNFIPGWINNKRSKIKEKLTINKKEDKSIKYIYKNPYVKLLSIKDISKVLFICIILLLKELIGIASTKFIDNYKKEEYEDKFNFIPFLIIYLFSKYNNRTQTYYKHQNFSFLILSLVEIIKIIFFLYREISNSSNNISPIIPKIISEIIDCILYSVYFLNIKGIMEYKYISPYKCNYIIGIINTPLIIILYIIISFTSLGNNNDNYYYKISTLFDDIINIDIINAFILISFPLFYGILVLLINKTIK